MEKPYGSQAPNSQACVGKDHMPRFALPAGVRGGGRRFQDAHYIEFDGDLGTNRHPHIDPIWLAIGGRIGRAALNAGVTKGDGVIPVGRGDRLDLSFCASRSRVSFTDQESWRTARWLRCYPLPGRVLRSNAREGDEHFSVYGTLIKARASMKSFQQKAEGTPPDNERPDDPPTPSIAPDNQPTQSEPETEPMPRTNHRNRNAEVDFKGEKRSNATHASTTDPEARLYKKSPGTGATLCFMGHALMENRHGLVVQGDLTQADGHAERRAALDMVHRHSPGSTRRLTLGADKGYDAAEFVSDLREACITPHVAQKLRYSAIDGRTTRHRGYALSIKHRKRIEEAFGWAKTVGGMAQTVYRGVERVRSRFILTMAANNLARLPRLLAN